MFLPRVDFRRAVVIKRYNLGNYLAEVYTNCKSLGRAEFQYVMIFLDKYAQLSPCLAVATEVVKENQDILGEYVLTVFPGRGYFQLNKPGEWDDLQQFTDKALEIAEGHFSTMQLAASA